MAGHAECGLHLIVVFSGILFYLGLSNFAQVKAVAGQVFSLLSPFFIGIAIAYLLMAPPAIFRKSCFAASAAPLWRFPLSVRWFW